MPKKCGSLAGKKVIPIAEAVAKIKAAADARTDPDFVIIGRSDADMVSVEEVIERCNRYLEAGADMAFPVFVQLIAKRSPAQTLEIYKRVAREVQGPCVWVYADWDPGLTAVDVQKLGFKMAVYPVFTLLAATAAMKTAANELKTTGTPAGYFKKNLDAPSVAGFLKLIGLPEIQKMEDKYSK
jgi:2-methylisocitrate lyase-like PEP mutase family enzyme